MGIVNSLIMQHCQLMLMLMMIGSISARLMLVETEGNKNTGTGYANAAEDYNCPPHSACTILEKGKNSVASCLDRQVGAPCLKYCCVNSPEGLCCKRSKKYSRCRSIHGVKVCRF